MTSRRIGISSGWSTPSRLIVSVTLVFGGPRIWLSAFSGDNPCVVLPFSPVMMSPALIPALDAGVSSIGLITLKKPFSGTTSTPRPPNSPLVSTCIARNCSAFMNVECGSRPVSMPLMASLMRSVSETGSTYSLRTRSNTSPNKVSSR